MLLLEEVRAQGYAVSNEEIERGLRSVAVPILDAGGQTVASMSIAASASRRTLESMPDTLLPELESVRRMLATML
jgi:IclR family pca regulon transcriptional regulator